MVRISKKHLVPILILVLLPKLTEMIFLPVLPHVAKALNAESALLKYSISAYVFGYAIGVFFWGFVSETLGVKRTLFISFFLFAVLSFFGLYVTDVTELFFLRILMAFCISSSPAMVYVLVATHFKESTRRFLFSYMSMAMAFAPAFGPIFSHHFTRHFYWNYLFLMTMIMGALGTYLSIKFFPDKPKDSLSDTLFEKKFFRELKRVIRAEKRILLAALFLGMCHSLITGYFIEAPFYFSAELGIVPVHFGLMTTLVGVGIWIGGKLSIKLEKGDKWIAASNLCILGGACLIIFFSAININKNVSSQLFLLEISVSMGFVCVGVGIIHPATLNFAVNNLSKCNHIGAHLGTFCSIYFGIVALSCTLIIYSHLYFKVPFIIFIPVFAFVILCLSILWNFFERKDIKKLEI